MAITSIRKLIVAAIITKLKTIKIVNGYNTDLADSVVDWQITNVAIDDLPQIEVKDPSASSERRGSMDYSTVSIELVGRVVGTIDSARDFLTDMTAAMNDGPTYPDSVYLSELIDKPELAPDERDKRAVKVSMSYEVKYRE